MESSEYNLCLCGSQYKGGGVVQTNVDFCVCYCFNRSVYAGDTLSQHKGVHTALTHTSLDHALQGAVVTSPRLLLYMH